MGVGSEVYGAVKAGRKGIGIELKPTYFNQAMKNVAAAMVDAPQDDPLLFAPQEEDDTDADEEES
jgi:hypothetical protein